MLPFNQSQMFKAVRVQVPIKDSVQLSEEQIVVSKRWIIHSHSKAFDWYTKNIKCRICVLLLPVFVTQLQNNPIYLGLINRQAEFT